MSLILILAIGLIGYLVYAMVMMSKPDPEAKCTDVELIVCDNPHSYFVDEKGIEAMLRDAGLYPKDEKMSTVDTKKIEELISSNDFVEKVECYKTSSNKLCVKVAQRTPVLYVLPNSGDGYFVDYKGKKISKTSYVSNIITATGNIDEAFACEQLVGMAKFIESDDFWNNQVEQIFVMKNKYNKHVIEIIPRVGDQVVYFGDIEDYENKFYRLKKFYMQAVNTVGWNKYSRIDLQYDNQVICKKRKI